MDNVLALRENDDARIRKIGLSGGTCFIVWKNPNGTFDIPALCFNIFRYQLRGSAEITIKTDHSIGPETATAYPGRFGFWFAVRS